MKSGRYRVPKLPPLSVKKRLPDFAQDESSNHDSKKISEISAVTWFRICPVLLHFPIFMYSLHLSLQPNGQTSFIGFASIFLAKEGGRSLISCWRNWGRRGLEAGAGSWSAWRTKSSKFEILLRLKSISFLSKVLVWLFV